ncbi:mRNA splicing protein sme1 [Hanseniaspora vineae]
MIPPINSLFNQLQEQKTVTIWLYEQLQIRIRGKIAGFDEFMNVVIDDAEEIPVDVKTGKELIEEATKIGRMLLKGDNITLITTAEDGQ